MQPFKLMAAIEKLARKGSRKTKGNSRGGLKRLLWIENLENRTLLASNFLVTTTADSGAGSLRQAILSANATANAVNDPDRISFAIPANDPRHVYYVNNNTPGSVQRIAVNGTTILGTTTQATDNSIPNIDPDWPHSWYSIQLATALPILSEAVVIDAFTQLGARPNSNPISVASNELLRIELVGVTGNEFDGLVITGGGSTVRGMSIHGFGFFTQKDGIELASAGNTIEGNHLGIDVSGLNSLTNQGAGVFINNVADNLVGGATEAARNLIAANRIGVAISGINATGNRVQGSKIVGQSNVAGVLIDAGANNNVIGGETQTAANVIGFNQIGVHITGLAGTNGTTGNRVEGNFIGTDPSGSDQLSNNTNVMVSFNAANNVIGGLTSTPGRGRGNLISSGLNSVIVQGATGTRIEGNLIGTHPNGNAPFGAFFTGVMVTGGTATVIGGPNAQARNVISGSLRQAGVVLQTDGALVQNNFIGTDVTGTQDIGNGGGGVHVFGSGNIITGNVIAFSKAFDGGESIEFGNGVSVLSGAGNAILENSIFSNQHLGIELAVNSLFDGLPLPNDAGDGDSGVNNLQNYPALRRAAATATDLTIEGSLNSTPNSSFRIDLFASTSADLSGWGEGQTSLGSIVISTDASGNSGPFTFARPGDFRDQFYSATATRLAPVTLRPTDTSEFSAALRIDVTRPTFISIVRHVPLTSPTSADQVTFRVTFDEDMANVDTADFALSGTAAGDGTIAAVATAIGTRAFDVTVTGLTNSNGTIGLDLSVGHNITDLQGNSLVSAVPGIDEEYVLANLDFGDAPDTYRTTATSDGARHIPTSQIFLGAVVDGDTMAQPSAAANGDDVNQALPDDEDGLTYPLADLTLTVGAAPTVNVRATNTTGSAATLFGWIDFNANGIFDNATERAQAAVASGTNNGIVTLVFPAVPAGFTGKTYARFRLSTDAAAAIPTGLASDGEVEDYPVTITRASDGTADNLKTKKLAHLLNGMPALANASFFGFSTATLGDLDLDGVSDLAVGAPGTDGSGAVFVLFLNSSGTVKSFARIGNGTGGGPPLNVDDFFGVSVASMGDLDGDGVTDLAVGAFGDDSSTTNAGAVYVLFMNTDGSVKRYTKIASGVARGPTLATGEAFGRSLAALGDLNGDGVTDLAVGASGDVFGISSNAGVVHVLFMKTDGTVSSYTRLAGAFTAAGDGFGSSMAAIGDLDGDGLTELAIGANKDGGANNNRGAMYVAFMRANGTIKSMANMVSGTGGGPTLADGGCFGESVASLGDLDGNGVPDLAVGSYRDECGILLTNRGAVYVLFMNSNGSVKNSQKIARNTAGGPILDDFGQFGTSLTSLGDLNGDGVIDLAVGARTDNTGGFLRGAVYTLFLNPLGLDFGDAPTAAQSGISSSYPTTLSNDGARHGFGGPRLGLQLDTEAEGQPTAAATGDDAMISDDEDGVTLLPLLRGRESSVLINMQQAASAQLDFWIDFNRDGDWNDASERIGNSIALIPGNNIVVFGVPADAAVGETFARFRVSTAGGLLPTGLASDGEVEDYVVSIQSDRDGDGIADLIDTQPLVFSNDFSDGVTAGSISQRGGGVSLTDLPGPLGVQFRRSGIGGTAEVLVGTSGGPELVRLNSALEVAAITNGPPTPVNGSTTVTAVSASPFSAIELRKPPTGPGTSVFLRTGQTATLGSPVTASVENIEPVAVQLNNRAPDGKEQMFGLFELDPGESGDVNFTGPNTVEIAMLIGSANVTVEGQSATLSEGNPAMSFTFNVVGDDFGDAPDTYHALLASNGPRHTVGSGLFLGSGVDAEADGIPTANAGGDDGNLIDDEDGVLLPAAIVARLAALARVTSSKPGKLDAWVDFNRNGVFDTSEQIAAGLPLVAGENSVAFAVPSSAVAGPSFARFRISSAGGLPPIGPAVDGEVEDYALQIRVLAPGTATIVDDPSRLGKRVLVVVGTSSNDTITFQAAVGIAGVYATLKGKSLGNFPLAASDRLAALGGPGNDTIIVKASLQHSAELYGDDGNDKLTGGAGHDQIFGGGGNEDIHGGAGDDRLFGEDGNDHLSGGPGNDQLSGGEGNDTLQGDAGTDFLDGSNGNDTLFGASAITDDPAADIVLGGDGNDRMFGSHGRDFLIGGRGVDAVDGRVGEDLLVAGFTTRDGDRAFLQQISLAWQAAAPHKERMTQVRAQFVVAGAIAFDDSTRDRLRGGTDLDWYFADQDGRDHDDDRFQGRTLDEVVDSLSEALPALAKAAAMAKGVEASGDLSSPNLSLWSASHNPFNPADASGDEFTTPLDVLLIINHLNQHVASELTGLWDREPEDGWYLDITNDGNISPLDALWIINVLNVPPLDTFSTSANSTNAELEASSILFEGEGEGHFTGGAIAYDLGPAAWRGIQADRTRHDLDYVSRVAKPTTDNGATVPKLAMETLRSNVSGKIFLAGTNARDSYFASLDLDLLDSELEEAFIW